MCETPAKECGFLSSTLLRQSRVASTGSRGPGARSWVLSKVDALVDSAALTPTPHCLREQVYHFQRAQQVRLTLARVSQGFTRNVRCIHLAGLLGPKTTAGVMAK